MNLRLKPNHVIYKTNKTLLSYRQDWQLGYEIENVWSNLRINVVMDSQCKVQLTTSVNNLVVNKDLFKQTFKYTVRSGRNKICSK